MITNDYSRKDFMKLFGMGAAALAFSGLAFPQKRRYIAPLGFQLYTVRKQIEKDLEGTIRRVADMGYLGVETYALPPNITLSEAAKVFRKAGLKVFGMHTELPVGDQRDNILRMAEAYTCDHVIYPGWPQGEKYKSLEATKRTAGIYDEAAAYLKTQGLRFGLHNHWWEFEKVDGIYPFYYLLKHLSSDVFFEIDTYWAKTGGQNPTKVVSDFGKRSPFLHIKDGPAIKGEKAYEQVPAGAGAMDFPSIVRAGGQNTQWMIVEFDEYAGDIFQGMQQSYTYLSSHGLGRGRV
jgi:sugar phosphate isomerase/epimerase